MRKRLLPEQRAQLQAQYDQLQAEIAQWQSVLDDTRAKKNSLQGDVTALNAQIAKAQAEIKQRTVTIATLGSEIQKKTATIQTLEHSSRAAMSRSQNSCDKKTRPRHAARPPGVFFRRPCRSFSQMQTAIDSINTRTSMQQFQDLRATSEQASRERDALDTQKNAQLDAKHEVEVKKQQITNDQTQKKELLAVTTESRKDLCAGACRSPKEGR
jgi:septal ring factor EnvC (AmiA/AmiB activator)